MFFIYVIMAHLAFLLALPYLLLHPRLRQGFRWRCGRLPAEWPGFADGAGPVVWFHGASAGDLLALRPLIIRLRRERPDARVVVTTVTSSGLDIARRSLAGMAAVGYAPFDLPWAVQSFVRAIRPRLLVLEYAELWPALIRRVHDSGAAVALVNGRLSPGLLGRYRLLYRLAGNPLQRLARLCMRDRAEAQRALKLGARPETVVITGNTKFDDVMAEPIDPGQLRNLAVALGLREGEQVWLAASTHGEENEMVLATLERLRRRHQRLRLVLAPRYLEEVEAIKRQAEKRGLSWGTRSAGCQEQEVLILDTVGEVRLACCLATMVFVGGSLVPRGGHNILEPAACGRPVLFGPYMDNFRAAEEVLLGRGGIRVRDAEQLYRVLAELLEQPAEITKLGAMARQALHQAQGATTACWRALAPLLEKGAGA